jgi:peptide/nickel transport system substrate-binding protein
MRRSSRILALAMALGLIGAACGDDDDGAAAVDEEDVAETDEGCTEDRVGGSATMGVQIMAGGLDPTVALGTGIAGATEITAFYDALMRYDPETDEFEPHLAESLEPNDDFTEWTLTLREGVTFGNGDPLTAEAVQFSIERLAGALVAAAGMAQEVESMDVVDDHTITFTLIRPWGGFPYLLAAEGGMVVNPTVVVEVGDDFANNPEGAGVGPYEFERFAPGEEIVLTAKDDYWGGPVCIETLRFTSVPGGQGTYDAFRAGELDVMFMSDAEAIADAKDDGVNHAAALSGGQGYLLNGGMGDSPVLADIRLRQAVAHAVDVEAINERVYGGTALPGTGLAHPDQTIYPGIDGLEYDPDRASELVDEVKEETGWDGSIRLTGFDTPESMEQSIVVEAMLETVGFEVEVENLPQEQALQKILFEADYDIGAGAASVFDAGPVRGLNQFHSESVRNRVGLGSPEMDAAIEDLYMAADVDEMAEAMVDVQEAFNELVPAANVLSAEWFVGWQEHIGGLTTTRESTVMFHEAYVD